MANAKSELPGARFAASAHECARASDVLVVMTPWDEFRALGPADLKRGGVLIDCWRLFAAHTPETATEYIAVGRGDCAHAAEAERAIAAAEGRGK
jgi:hypothetical protein